MVFGEGERCLQFIGVQPLCCVLFGVFFSLQVKVSSLFSDLFDVLMKHKVQDLLSVFFRYPSDVYRLSIIRLYCMYAIPIVYRFELSQTTRQ